MGTCYTLASPAFKVTGMVLHVGGDLCGGLCACVLVCLCARVLVTLTLASAAGSSGLVLLLAPTG